MTRYHEVCLTREVSLLKFFNAYHGPQISWSSILFTLNIILTFHTRSRRTKNNRSLLLLTTNNSQIACIVTRSFLLFVRMFMFLINNNQSKWLHRREDRWSSPYNNSCSTLSNFMPFVMSFSSRQMTMKNCNQSLQWTVTKSSFESFYSLRC